MARLVHQIRDHHGRVHSVCSDPLHRTTPPLLPSTCTNSFGHELTRFLPCPPSIHPKALFSGHIYCFEPNTVYKPRPFQAYTGASHPQKSPHTTRFVSGHLQYTHRAGTLVRFGGLQHLRSGRFQYLFAKSADLFIPVHFSSYNLFRAADFFSLNF